METIDDIEGVKPGEVPPSRDAAMCSISVQVQYDGNGNPEPVPTALERAESLFSALDRNNDGSLTK